MSRRATILLLIATHLTTFCTFGEARYDEREIIGSASTRRNHVARGDSSGYTNPKSNGGYMLTIANNTYPAGLGEPLNIILSANSDKDVLKESTDDGGFLNFMLSTNIGEECLGQHLGDPQFANLGDGHGNVTQIEELRWNYGNPYIGTCQETFQGGLHLRYWIQNTTGAYFMATSIEKSAVENHDIPVNGYDLGRDYLVGNITGKTVDTLTVTNQTSLSGTSNYNNYTYQTNVQYVSGLLQNSSDGINHYQTVAADGRAAIDGLVAVLTVKITERPKGLGFSTISQLSPLLITVSILLTSFLSLS